MTSDEFKRAVVQVTMKYLRDNQGKKITSAFIDGAHEELSEMLENTIEGDIDDDE